MSITSWGNLTQAQANILLPINYTGVIRKLPVKDPKVGLTVIDRFGNIATVKNVSNPLHYTVEVKCRDGEIRCHEEPSIAGVGAHTLSIEYKDRYFPIVIADWDYILKNNLIGSEIKFHYFVISGNINEIQRGIAGQEWVRVVKPDPKMYSEEEVKELVVKGVREVVSEIRSNITGYSGQDVRNKAIGWANNNIK